MSRAEEAEDAHDGSADASVSVTTLRSATHNTIPFVENRSAFVTTVREVARSLLEVE